MLADEVFPIRISAGSLSHLPGRQAKAAVFCLHSFKAGCFRAAPRNIQCICPYGMTALDPGAPVNGDWTFGIGTAPVAASIHSCCQSCQRSRRDICFKFINMGFKSIYRYHSSSWQLADVKTEAETSVTVRTWPAEAAVLYVRM